MKKLLIVLLVVGGFASCNKKIDIEAENQKLLIADKNFSVISETKNMNLAFEMYADSNAVMLIDYNLPIEGKDNIVAQMKSNFDENIKFRWEPTKAVVSQSGDIGYTYGVWMMDKKVYNETKYYKGTYVNVWKKDNKGDWKFVIHSDNFGLYEEEKAILQ